MLWAISLLLLAFSALLIVGNWAAAIGTLWTKKSTSLIPFLGGLFGLIGCLLCPEEWVSAAWWVSLVLDPTICIFAILGLLMLFESPRDRQAASKGQGEGETRE